MTDPLLPGGGQQHLPPSGYGPPRPNDYGGFGPPRPGFGLPQPGGTAPPPPRPPPAYSGPPRVDSKGVPGSYQGGAAPGPYQPQLSAQQPSYMPPGATVVVQPNPRVVAVGGCSACRVGVLVDDFTACGVLWAIFCFPIGILCFLAMSQQRCPNCGAVFR